MLGLKSKMEHRMVVNAKLFGSDGREEKSMSQPKADILVVDDQPDVFELDIVGHKSVCTDDDVDFTLRHTV